MSNATVYTEAQHENGTIQRGKYRDAWGLKLLQQCGYTWVKGPNGWRQVGFAIRDLELAESLAVLVR